MAQRSMECKKPWHFGVSEAMAQRQNMAVTHTYSDTPRHTLKTRLQLSETLGMRQNMAVTYTQNMAVTYTYSCTPRHTFTETNKHIS